MSLPVTFMTGCSASRAFSCLCVGIFPASSTLSRSLWNFPGLYFLGTRYSLLRLYALSRTICVFIYSLVNSHRQNPLWLDCLEALYCAHVWPPFV